MEIQIISSRLLDQIADFNSAILVPGHGPPGTGKDLSLLKEYIMHCRQVAEDMHNNGEEESSISRKVIPEAYSTWELPNFYAANLRFFYRQLSAEKGE
jgi:hypothetical protein